MDSNEILRFISALVLVVSLMGGLWFVLKKIGVNGGFGLQQGTKRRLKIVEILPLDIKHKAVILRCDDKDHLVILGPNGETVIEKSLKVREEKNDV